MGERRGTKALELWCRRMTDGYPGVRVDNMTTSWRDGLAFCAMIHHFRPDLIDFSSLNKDDVYGNNDLAFRVAEQHLGIPALLDAEDMVSCPVPDRLSILTYLSQFYKTFAGTSQVGSPTRIIPKRPSGVTECGMVSPSSSSPPTKVSVLQHNRVGGMSRREPCAKCKLPVFIAERLHVGKQLYHRTCFKCARCSHQLSLADYYETEEGKYCCETCPDEDISIYSDAKDSLKQKSLSDEEKELKIKSIEDDDDYNTAFENTFEQDEAMIARRTEARSSFFSKQLFPDDESISSVSSISEKLENKSEMNETDEADVSLNKSKDDLDEEPPELPSSKPPDLKPSNLTTVFDLEVSSDIDCVVINEQSVNETSVVQDNVDILCSDTSVQPSVANLEAPFSISDTIDDSTNKNVTKDTNECGEISIVKARRLLFETNVKPDITRFDKEPFEKSHTEVQSDVVEISTQVPSVEIVNLDNAQSECDVRSEIINIDDNKLDVVTSTKDNSYIEPIVESVETNTTASSDSQGNLDSPVLKITNPIVLLKSVLENLSDVDSDMNDINSSILNDSSLKLKNEPNYPVDLNPFGDDDDDVEVETKPKKESTNPFGSSDEEEEIKKEEKPQTTPRSSRQNQFVKKVIPAPRVSLNPFWSDGEEPSDEEMNTPPVPKPRTSKTLHLTPEPSPKPRKIFNSGSHYSSASSLSSLNSTPSGTTRKKKPAPKPPISKEFLTATSQNTSAGHTLRKTRPAPAPPTSTPFETAKVVMDVPMSPISSRTEPMKNAISKENIKTQSDSSPTVCNEWEKEKMGKDETNRNRQSMTSDSLNVNSPNSDTNLPAPNKSTFGKWKRKKGQAPARPVPQRRQIKALPIVELRSELESIEIQQQGLEKQGVKLEQIIREKCEGPGVEEDFTMTIEVEDLVLQLFELVNEKNELFRKQAELMYLRRQQRLEEEHADLEYQIRCLMSQPESNKTDSDKAHEEELINRLVEVVERRNEIVQCLEMDRIREAEEDFSISTQMTLLALKREEENQEKESPPVKLSKKEKKKIKKERKGKGDSKVDADKDVDESETSATSIKEKKKKKWFLHK